MYHQNRESNRGHRSNGGYMYSAPSPSGRSDPLTSPPPPYSPPRASSPPPPMLPRIRVPRDETTADETTSLIDGNYSKKSSRHPSRGCLILVFYILVIASLALAVPSVSVAIQAKIAVSKGLRDKLTLDIKQLQVRKKTIVREVQSLEREQIQQRQAWERERQANEERRRGHMPFWGEPRLTSAKCPRDRIRTYKARMHNLLVEDDWHGACMNETIRIDGRSLYAPYRCVNYGLDDGVFGHWSFGVNICECPKTIWDRFKNIFRCH
ncbi:hypothetical protein BC834DRAFT_868323 [Gloeopeniophorella convolvens]|nr:hypothetical protein BC834DRAFT_868323 [Gloeopeniophorella convolvens]